MTISRDKFLTGKEVAQLLNLPEVTIQRWVHQGKIPYKTLNEKTVVAKNELINWAKAHDLVIHQKTNDIKIAGVFSLAKTIESGGIYTGIEGTDTYTVFQNALNHLDFIESKKRELILDEFINREELASTGVGNGIAIPHSRNRTPLNLDTARIPVFFLKNPISFNAIDFKPVFVLFMIFTTNLKEHLKILSKLSYILKQKSILNIIGQRDSNNSLLKKILEIENEQNIND